MYKTDRKERLVACRDLAKCLNERGMCHGQLSQHNEAWEDYEEAVALLEDPEAPSSAVRKRSQICTNSPPFARTDCAQIAKLSP